MHPVNKVWDSLVGMNTNVLQIETERYLTVIFRANTTNSKITEHWKPERLTEFDMPM